MPPRRDHPIWEMGDGDTVVIPTDALSLWYKTARRVEDVTNYLYRFERLDKVKSKVTCYSASNPPEFDGWKPDRPKPGRRKTHPLHDFEIGQTFVDSHLRERSWRSTAYNIERQSGKRFLFTRHPMGFKVERLPDWARKSSYKPPKSKYGFHEIHEDHMRIYYYFKYDVEKVANALRQYEKRSAHGFNMEWKEDGLYVTRLW